MLSLRLAIRFLRQSFRTRALKTLMVSVILATTTIFGIGLFVGAIDTALNAGSAELIAADRQLISSKPVKKRLISKAASFNLSSASSLNLRSMVLAGDEMQLVAVKGVSDTYPLRGRVAVKDHIDAETLNVKAAPKQGEAWLSPRLLPLLGVDINDRITLGNLRLTVTKIVVKEPDVRVGFATLAPRVMTNRLDVESSGLVIPGSRLSYTFYFTGDQDDLERYASWLRPRLVDGQEWVSVKDGRPAVSNSLVKAEQYLNLGGALALILTMTAILVAAREYSYAQIDPVGLMKALGVPYPVIRNIYVWQLAIIALAGWAIGVMVGGVVFSLAVWLVQSIFPLPGLGQLGVGAFIELLAVSLFACLVCVFAFIFPMLGGFRTVSPMLVLRQQRDQMQLPRHGYSVTLLSLLAILAVYVGSGKLLIGLVGGLLFLLLLTRLFMLAVFALIEKLIGNSAVTNRYWHIAKLGIKRLVREKNQTTAQVFALSTAIMVLLVLTLVRSTLLDEWQASLPENTPNHFLVNVSPEQVGPIKIRLAEAGIYLADVYPMVRGRLIEVNGLPVKQTIAENKSVEALNRELNLTWSEQLPEANTIEAGKWWSDPATAQDAAGSFALVSVESRLAKRLNIDLGDRLTFLLGDQTTVATVASIRGVKWESMKPNFYVVFSPGALNAFPATYMSSFYLPPSNKLSLNQVQLSFPTVTILEIDQFIARIQTIIAQVTNAIEIVLLLVLAGAVMVVVAITNSTLNGRLKEGSIVRALGGGRELIKGSQFAEFLLLGIVSSLWGIISAELVVAVLVTQVFALPANLHPVFWPMFIIGASVVVCLTGMIQLASVTRVAPTRILQQVG